MRLLEIGQIIKTRGLKGSLKVVSFLDVNRATLLANSKILICHNQKLFRNNSATNGITDVPDSSLITHHISKIDPHPNGNHFFVNFVDIDTIEKAEPLVGASMLITPESLEELPPDEHYWFELLGMSVETESGDVIGKITAIFPSGSNDIFVCQGKVEEILLPAIPDCIINIDKGKHLMTVRILEGL
ncbi:MAG: ribosome maturation factor RimM [Deltaproteobacteria bacterium]